MHLPKTCASVLSLVVLGALSTGCNRQSGPDPAAEIARLTSELETTKQKLDLAQKNATSQQDALSLASTSIETERKQVTEKDQALLKRDAQISALQHEITELKNRDAFIYADISAEVQKGVPSLTLGRYEQFIKDFPNSPLVADATRAIKELTVTSQREAQTRTALIDPLRPERDALKHWNDGIASAEELMPFLRRKTQAEIIKLLGNPSRTFRNGSEFGYVDKVIDSKTGLKDTLIIIFEENRVSSLRIGYQGKEIKL